MDLVGQVETAAITAVPLLQVDQAVKECRVAAEAAVDQPEQVLPVETAVMVALVGLLVAAEAQLVEQMLLQMEQPEAAEAA